MSLGFSRSSSFILLLCLAVSSLPVGRVCAQGTQRSRRSIELTETNAAEILTNLNQLTVKKEGLRELEDQLRAIKGISGSKSLEQRFNAPYAAPSTPVPSKALRELLERHKNWELTPEELGMGGLSSSSTASFEMDSLNSFASDKSDGSKSSLQQFYDALNPSGKDHQNKDHSADKSFNMNSQSDKDEFSYSSDDTSLPPALREKAQKLKESVIKDSGSFFNPVRTRSSFENFFGLNPAEAVNKNLNGPKTSVDSFLDQFKKGMETSSTIPGIDPTLQSLLPSAASDKSVSVPNLDTLPITKHHELTESTPGNVTTVTEHSVLPDINSTVLNAWNPLYTPPKLELPKYTPPTPPNLDFPRRKF